MRTTSSRVLTALILTAHSNMWDWFSHHVTQPVLYLQDVPIASRLNPDVQARLPNNWILCLYQTIHIATLVRPTTLHLVASKFIEGLVANDYVSPIRQTGKTSRVLHHAEAAVCLWLRFIPIPGSSFSTSRAIATFISVASTTFKNTNFLYLQYIQDRIKTLRASLTDERVHVTKIPWEKLSQELERHPFANPTSVEAIALGGLKKLLWKVSGLPIPNPTHPEMAPLDRRTVEVGGDVVIGSSVESITSPRPV